MEQSEIMDISKAVHKIVVVTKNQPPEEFSESLRSNYSSNETSFPEVTRITREVEGSIFEVEDFTTKVVPIERISNLVSPIDRDKIVIKVSTGTSGIPFHSGDVGSKQNNFSRHKDVLDEACAELNCGDLTAEEHDFKNCESMKKFENSLFDPSNEKCIIGTNMPILPSSLPLLSGNYGVCDSKLQSNFHYLHNLETEMNINRKVCELEARSSLCNMKSICKQARDVAVTQDLSHHSNFYLQRLSDFEQSTIPVMCNTVTSGLESSSICSSNSSCMNNDNVLNYNSAEVPISYVPFNKKDSDTALISDEYSYQPISSCNITSDAVALNMNKNNFNYNNEMGDVLICEKNVEPPFNSSSAASNSTGIKDGLAICVNNVEFANAMDQCEYDDTIKMVETNSTLSANDGIHFKCVGNVDEADATCSNNQSYHTANQAEHADGITKPLSPLKYTISLPDIPTYIETMKLTSEHLISEAVNVPPSVHSLYKINPNSPVHLSLEVEKIFQKFGQKYKCHAVTFENARFIYNILEESGDILPFSTEEKVISSLVFGSISSRYPLVLTQKIRRLYRLQFSLPILIAIIIQRIPDLPIDLDPRSYLNPLMVECGINDDEVKKCASKLLMALHKLEYRETGMSQQWAVAALIWAIRVSKKSCRDTTTNLKNYSKSIKVLNYTIKRLAKIESNQK